jgi:hypothetical protein
MVKVPLPVCTKRMFIKSLFDCALYSFSYFSTTGASASELYLVFWKAVNYLAMFGFSVTFLSMDGTQH